MPQITLHDLATKLNISVSTVSKALKGYSDVSAKTKKAVIDLVKTYFKLGGMQIQINVIDQNVLKEAIKNPENYNDLIVRVGGYSEYFNRLSYELKLTILERCEYNG